MTRARGRHLSIQSIIIISLLSTAAIALFISIFVKDDNPHLAKKVDSTNASLDVEKKASINYGLPVRLKIPKINVNADIQQMGLTPEGDMEAPETNEAVGWYKYGTRPGNEGSAVIDGHLGLDDQAVFGQLSSLKKSDVLTITDEHEQDVSFGVTAIRRYSYDAAPKEVFTSASGAHLNLITCDGAWKTGQNTFADRLVVFADKLH